jgi:hypothetical protein
VTGNGRSEAETRHAAVDPQDRAGGRPGEWGGERRDPVRDLLGADQAS